MKSTWMVSWIEEEFERKREEEFQATLRRPDALPLPPEEPKLSLGERLSRVVSGSRRHAQAHVTSPSPVPARARSVSPTRAIRRGDDEATVA